MTRRLVLQAIRWDLRGSTSYMVLSAYCIMESFAT